MLTFLGLESVGELFRSIPEALRIGAGLPLGAGMSEPDAVSYLAGLVEEGGSGARGLCCFAGGGAYDRYVPPAVTALAGRAEFVTSYTPYQAEVAQGVLQALFEFQSMVSRLSGLPVSNASLYDGAWAMFEAVNMALAATGRDEVWVSAGVNPAWRDLLSTLLSGREVRVTTVPLHPASGATLWDVAGAVEGGEARGDGRASTSRPACLAVAYPNYLGVVEDLGAVKAICERLGAKLVADYDPVAMGLLRNPGSYGADVAVAEGQSLGIPLSFGGPYLGMLSATRGLMRLMPGRIVGMTTDVAGRQAFVSTLRAREQDIRRERATSNVCTNETLMAVMATVHMAWLGPKGLSEVARRSAAGAHLLHRLLCSAPGVEPLYSGPFFAEFSLEVPPEPAVLLERLAEEGFLGGVAIGPAAASRGGRGGAADYKEGLIVAVTERRTAGEIEAFAEAFGRAVK